MSERNPGELTRQPRLPSAGGPETVDDDIRQPTPEEALAEAQEAVRRAEADAASARRQASEATQRATAAEAGRVASDQGALTAREQSILSSIDAQKNAAEQAQSAIANAQAAGDSVAVAAAFRQLAAAEAKINSLTGQKEWFDSERERLKNAPPQPQQQQSDGYDVPTPTGGTIRASSQVKSWVDAHPRFSTDRDYYNHAVTAHATVTSEGIQEGSPAYFRALDETMRKFEDYEAYQRGERQVSERTNTSAPRRPASSTAAPVTRGSVAPGGSRGEPNALDIARHLGVTPEDLREFARVNGFKGEEGYKRYLAGHQEIIEIQRAGGDAGLKTDASWR